MNTDALLFNSISYLAAPAVFGIINKTKAWFGGRKGAPVLQPYFDIAKLLKKGIVYSVTSTWIFRAGPVFILAAAAFSLMLIPVAHVPSAISFSGDLFLLAGLFALMKFVAVIAALDTGSSFEGMGASREMLLSVLAEPALFLLFGALLLLTGGTSISEILNSNLTSLWASGNGATLAVICAGLFLLLLAENSRIPVDDPDTHLELTMIHEVMILDSSGPDLAYLQYAAALKLWVFASLIVSIVMPFHTANHLLSFIFYFAGISAVALVIGAAESSMARLKLTHLPNMMIFASLTGVMSIALALALR